MVGVSLTLAATFSVVAVGVAQVQVSDAASAGARLAARGESAAVVRATAAQMGGPGAEVGVRPGGQLTQVTVTRVVALLLPGRPSVRVDSQALAVSEVRSATGWPGPPASDPP